MKGSVSTAQELRTALKELIIDTLKLEDVTIDDIEDNAPLFREGLALDSIDALELVVALEKNYNIIIEDENVGKKAFASVAALADFVRQERPKVAC